MDPISVTHPSESTNTETGKKLEILFDGHFYDVTNFIKRHPGGSIIKYYTEKGEDATQAIQQFHQRSSKRVSAMMSSLQKRKASDSEIELDSVVLKKNRALTEDFTKLYLELEKEGYFKPSYYHIFTRVVEVVVMEAFVVYLMTSQHFFVKFIGTVLMALTHGRCGWIQHECGHFSFSGYPKLDRFFHAIFMGFGFGMSSSWWSRQHNRHHAMPQRLNHDVDLDTMPFLAFNTKIVKNSKDGKGFMIQHQVYLFVLIDTLLVAFFWKFYLHPKFVLKRKYYVEIISMLGHYLTFWYFGFWPMFFATWILSIYFYINFSLNHTFLPVTTEPTHWIEYSLYHTANVEQRPWCDWWMGYLNYQIEHHLFPAMPQFRHPLIKDRVKALADKHNIPYIVHSYAGAVRTSFKNLSNVAKELQSAT